MAFGEKAKTKKAENLNQGGSYLITAVPCIGGFRMCFGGYKFIEASTDLVFVLKPGYYSS